jgi:hypothetical protein
MSENVGIATAHETPNRNVFRRILNSLPDVIDYAGEFGAELVLFLPFCNWLSNVGLLRDKQIQTYAGMGCFYTELDCAGILEKSQRRASVPPQDRPTWLPIRNEHNFDDVGRSPFHLYPDLRQKFRGVPLVPRVGSSDRPILIIHNKYNDEWSLGPIDYIPLDALDIMFKALKQEFTVVYIRHGIGEPIAGYTEDHNDAAPFDDRALLSSHPDVLCFDDLYLTHRLQGGAQDVNTFKNVLYSRCYRFISTQGGGAHHIALYSGSLLVVLHRGGSEERWAYSDGYYGFMAPMPPIRAVCRNDDDLIRSTSLFSNSVLSDDRLLLSRGCEELLARFSPWGSANRRLTPTHGGS